MIIHSLHMRDCQVIATYPSRPNVRYSIVHVSREAEATFDWLTENLRKEHSALPRVLVFCRSISICACLYRFFLTMLQKESYEPVDSQPHTCNQLFAMFHARIDDDDKQAILESMVDPEGKCRVVFSTITFGMEVDIPNIRTVIHFGPSAGVEDYLEESGRAGHDGTLSNAILYYYPGCLLGHVSLDMKKYCKLAVSDCRRAALLRPFPYTVECKDCHPCLLHDCRDLCTQRCECGNDALHQPLVLGHSSSAPCEDDSEVAPCREVLDSQCQPMRQMLLDLPLVNLWHCAHAQYYSKTVPCTVKLFRVQ